MNMYRRTSPKLPRTTRAIALRPSGNEQGEHFYFLGHLCADECSMEIVGRGCPCHRMEVLRSSAPSSHDAPARHAALNLTIIRHWRERRRATIQITTMMMMMTSIQITIPLPWPMQTRISRTTTTTTTHPQKATTMTHQRTTMAQMRSTMPTSTSNPLVMQEWTTTLSMARVLQELMRMSQ